MLLIITSFSSLTDGINTSTLLLPTKLTTRCLCTRIRYQMGTIIQSLLLTFQHYGPSDFHVMQQRYHLPVLHAVMAHTHCTEYLNCPRNVASWTEVSAPMWSITPLQIHRIVEW